MNIKELDKNYYKVLFKFPEYNTYLIEALKRFYLVDKKGYFLPDNYSFNNKGYETFHYAKDKPNYRIDEFDQIDHMIFKFHVYENDGRSDFRWINDKKGIFHASGKRFYYSNDEKGYNITPLSAIGKLYFTNECYINEKITNYYSKIDCSPILSVKIKNLEKRYTNVLNNHTFDYSDLRPYEILYKKYYNTEDIKLNKAYNYEVGICEKYRQLKILLRNNLNIITNENLSIGIPSGIYFKSIEKRLTVNAIEKILYHLSDNNIDLK